jgi:hypothetical protein
MTHEFRTQPGRILCSSDRRYALVTDSGGWSEMSRLSLTVYELGVRATLPLWSGA